VLGNQDVNPSAGSAGVGVCDTVVQAMLRLNVAPTKQKAHEKFFLVDQDGLLGDGRDLSKLSDLQKPYVQNGMKNGMDLMQVIKTVKPTILLGLSGKGSIFTRQIVEEMSSHVDQPVIFPLSNPTRNSECTAQDAYTWSGGRVLFAGGSPFEDVTIGFETYHPSQCNNYYTFPGIRNACNN
jgi:malate dehydrogenase (oxaloacetate-decarboxylating)(NADP+)